MLSSVPVTHIAARAQSVLEQYCEAFRGVASIVVVSPDRFDFARSHPALQGWFLTDCATHFERIPGQAPPGPDQLVMQTSGTTGGPKMVRYTKEIIAACAGAIAESIPLDRTRDYVALVNPRLAYGLSVVHSHLLAGVPVRFEPAPVSLDAWTTLRDALRPNSSVYLLPHQSFLLAQDRQWSFDGPVELLFAGGAFTSEMAAHLRPAFPAAAVVNMYGQAELGPRISIGRSTLADFREGAVGTPLDGVEVRIADANGPDQIGVIEVASPFRMTSYFTADGTDEQRPPAWWPTGDIGFLSADGRLHVAGRDASDVNFLGSRLALAHLREVVCAVGGVLDCRVSAVDHAVYGQQPSIRVLVDAPADPAAEPRVRRALAAEVGSAASAMIIKIIDISALPDSGKL